MIDAVISWPSAPLTHKLVSAALGNSNLAINIVDKAQPHSDRQLLQWSSYDEIDHELTNASHHSVLASSYTFRKSLIRKHFLSRAVHVYLTKKATSVLRSAVPRTYDLELSFAEDLDEMWTDELWDLGVALDSAEPSWWILKPGMADRGMGIRLFNSRDQLQKIFETFDESVEEEETADDIHSSTTVVTSQLRHFVIQEYISTPLLLDPTELLDAHESRPLVGRKFHLRVYCVASGAIELYLYTRFLALFSSRPYETPSVGGFEQMDLRPHLTNSTLQTELGDKNVRLLDELEGFRILSGGSSDGTLTRMIIEDIITQAGNIIADTFRAALQNPIHFQPIPNAFELFGVDFLVSHSPDNPTNPFQVKILEINAEPAIELTGPRLTWILQDLFTEISRVCVAPFFKGKKGTWETGETRECFRKVMSKHVHGPPI